MAIDPVQGITTKVGIDATRPLNYDMSRFRKGVIPASVDLSRIRLR
ncbi:hypothetical protein [Vulcanisaeta sp. JCM 16161]|nr:hypothetical protein [Vulcanisaeta sp. JCM 16161]